MNTRFRTVLCTLLLTLALLSLGLEAAASTLNQNVSWTIDRAGTSTKYRVAAYGDSIYAGEVRGDHGGRGISFRFVERRHHERAPR
jgi:hypothetical protein